MKIKYLGTAAAEGLPALFCKCDNCMRARELGGKNIRSRSQAIIDGKILIDWPSDAYYHMISSDMNYADITSLLVTHIHEDHFYPDDLMNRRDGFAHLGDDARQMTVYGSEDVYLPFTRTVGKVQLTWSDKRPNNVNYRLVKPYEPFDVEGYTVTALRAYHGTEHPYIYLISKDGKTLLYAHDTDVFYDEVWQYLSDNRIRFDLVSLDCTEGDKQIRYHGHMNTYRNIETRDRLIAIGSADAGTVFVMNHFSHNGTLSVYEDMLPRAAELGFICSYDGLEIDF